MDYFEAFITKHKIFINVSETRPISRLTYVRLSLNHQNVYCLQAFLYKFSIELAAEYSEELHRQPGIAVRCLTPGFVATKLSRIRPRIKNDTGWTYVPGPRSYARYSLRSLGCHCACRKFRGLHRNRKPETGIGHKSGGSTGKEAGDGWLAGVISAVFASPSSPFSVGQTGIVTTGYPSHTLMVIY